MSIVIKKLQSLPYLLLVLATFFWGTNFVFSKALVEVIPPFQLSVMRWTIASIVFFPFVIKELKQNVAIMKKNWKVLLCMALTGIAGFNTLLYMAIQYTTSINASLVNSTCPLLIVILSVVFLKEKLVKWQYIGAVFSLIGVIIVITGGNLSSLWPLTVNPGDILVLAAVILWAIYSILMKKLGILLPKNPTFILTIYFAILCLLPFALFERTYHPVTLTSLPLDSLIGVIYLGVFPSIVSFICWNEGVMQIGPGKASNYLHLIVLFTTILAVVFGGEMLDITQIIGGLFILFGVILASNLQFLTRSG